MQEPGRFDRGSAGLVRPEPDPDHMPSILGNDGILPYSSDSDEDIHQRMLMVGSCSAELWPGFRTLVQCAIGAGCSVLHPLAKLHVIDRPLDREHGFWCFTKTLGHGSNAGLGKGDLSALTDAAEFQRLVSAAAFFGFLLWIKSDRKDYYSIVFQFLME